MSATHKQTERLPIIVVGAGIGGLSAAIHLAAAGQPVRVLEKNPVVGGKMGEMVQDSPLGPFRWDTGPSVITMRPVLEALFATAGRRLEEYLTLRPLSPLTRYFYADGTVLDASLDLARMTAQIETLQPRDVAGYLRFLAYAAELHRIVGPVFLYGRPPTWRTYLTVPPWDMLRVDPLRTMWMATRRFVRSDHLRQLLGRFATYAGGSPFLAPATLNVIAHVELNGGVWYPQGGIYAVAKALATLAQELGVSIETNQTVTQITLQAGAVSGVALADGSYLPAQAVIANVDVATTYAKLLPHTQLSTTQVHRHTRVEPSCSGFILLLGIAQSHPQLAHHNLLFSTDYRREFTEIFQQRRPPSDPTIYVAITSKSDPEDAPPGCENWFVLVNAPALDPTFNWQTEAPAYRERVLETLARRGLEVRHQIRCAQMLTPVDLAHWSGAHRGALYGQAPNSRWSAFRRPHNRCSDVAGLYFAGGTTHPGGGVPLVLLSGKAAATLLLEKLAPQ